MVNNFDANYHRIGGIGDYYKLVMFPFGEGGVATNARIFYCGEIEGEEVTQRLYFLLQRLEGTQTPNPKQPFNY